MKSGFSNPFREQEAAFMVRGRSADPRKREGTILKRKKMKVKVGLARPRQETKLAQNGMTTGK